MKKFCFLPIVLVFLLALGVGSAWSIVSLPTANFSGNAQTTAGIGTGELTFVGGTIQKINYLDGTSTTVNGVDESIIDMTVTISGATRTGDYTFTDATFKISDGTFNYLSASLSDIVFVTNGVSWFLNPGLDANNAATLNLSGVVLSTDATHPSRFIDELQSELGTNNFIGMKMILTILSGAIEGDSTSDILTGLIDGVPETVAPPTGARTIGYWKNHDEERAAFIGAAVSLSSVFDSTALLNYYLSKNGKKNMEEKARQQLAASLLNCASSLQVTTQLTTGELEIYNLIVEPDAQSATVGDAKSTIETVILTPDLANMENAKDLADEINNRDHN
jgi:hypothetical protein